MWVVAGHFLHIENFFSTGHPPSYLFRFFRRWVGHVQEGSSFCYQRIKIFMNISVASRWFDGLENVWIRSFSNLSS